MKYLFVNYELAKLLAEFSFDENCIGYYDNQKRFDLSDPISNSSYQSYWQCKGYYSAPTLEQAINWLMDKHQIFIDIETDCTSYPKFAYSVNKFVGNPKDLAEKEWYWGHPKPSNWFLYRTRKEAIEEAIKFAITLI
jgi:hypothetical protein